MCPDVQPKKEVCEENGVKISYIHCIFAGHSDIMSIPVNY